VARTLRAEGAEAAYRRFGRPNDSRLVGLGPAFGTKYLYFCQPISQTEIALIFDDLVSRWLFREASLDLRSTSWSDRTYRTYRRTMHGWAARLHGKADDLEFCIFQTMSDERSNQWRN
jgi:hypothetical protein